MSFPLLVISCHGENKLSVLKEKNELMNKELNSKIYTLGLDETINIFLTYFPEARIYEESPINNEISIYYNTKPSLLNLITIDTVELDIVLDKNKKVSHIDSHVFTQISGKLRPPTRIAYRK